MSDQESVCQVATSGTAAPTCVLRILRSADDLLRPSSCSMLCSIAARTHTHCNFYPEELDSVAVCLNVHVPFNFERTLLAVFLMSAVRSSNSCLVSEPRHQYKLGGTQQTINVKLKEATSKSSFKSLTMSPTGSERGLFLFVFGEIWLVGLCLPLVNHRRRSGQTDSARTWSTALASGCGAKEKGAESCSG